MKIVIEIQDLLELRPVQRVSDILLGDEQKLLDLLAFAKLVDPFGRDRRTGSA